MALVIAGIDEAGYGPVLGPLCVGLAVLRVEGWSEGQPAPNFWKMLRPQITRDPARGKKIGAVAVADSKKLKLANDITSGHPVMHLERGVLSLLRCAGGAPVEDDAGLLSALGAVFDGHECYGGEALSLPLAWTGEQVAIAANLVRTALARTGVSVLDVRCQVVCEPRFNEVLSRTGSKAEVNLGAIAAHLRRVWERWGGGGESLRIVCDRLGGRTSYAGVLERVIGEFRRGVSVHVVEETEPLSRYIVEDGRKRVGISFQVEGEEAHLPVALASMTAKLIREIAMMRFNRYWGRVWAERRGVEVELRPTVGYRGDAWRWLKDADGVLTQADREALVRRA